MTQFLPYAKQSISDGDRKAVSDSLTQNWITRAERVKAFEEAIAENVGAKFAVAFNSGSTALAASYFAADTGPFDRILTPPNSFIATIGPGMERGAKVVFVDIDPATGNIDLENLSFNLQAPKIRGKTLVVPIHFAGLAVDMSKLDDLLIDPSAVVIEDAAHALGSCYPTGEKVGSCAYSQMTVFSFHPAKTITTGEGGMVTTNDPVLYEKLQRYRNNGIRPFTDRIGYEVLDLTGNYNFTEMQAALGLSQLERLDAFVQKRRMLVEHYRKKLEGIPHLTFFTPQETDKTAYHLFVCLIDFEALGKTKQQVIDFLLEKQIGTQVHYIPLYDHPAVQKKTGVIGEYFPNMQDYFRKALSLPLYYDLTLEDVDRVCDTLRAYLNIG